MELKGNQPQPLIIPQLRAGITFSFEGYDSAGKPHWLIYDASRNKFFIIGWLDYQILQYWELGDAEKIVSAINTNTTLHAELHDIDMLIRFLKQHYLIEQSGYAIHQLGKEQKLFKKDNLIHWLISYYLFFRIPLWHPDKFLTRTQHIANLVFNRYVAYIMIFLASIALFQIGSQWDRFTHTFGSVFTLNGLFFYLIAFLICKFCHELGHAYMCKRYGVPVPSFGVAFLVFWPVLYTDTTLSWKLNSKQRLQIALAGMWVETYVTIIAALIWCNTSNLTVQSICYLIISVNWMASLLINVSPFMRFDGYYVLADFLKIPNLQPRAFALTRWQIRRWLFDWPEPPPEHYSRKMHVFLVTYSLITWIYRLVLYIGIAILVYHFFIKIVGIILFIIELFYFILGPILNEVRTWIHYKEKFSVNSHTIVTSSIVAMMLLLFFVPFNATIKLPGTLSYVHEFLVAPESGYIENDLPKVGSKVIAGQAIVTLNSPDLDSALTLVKLEYDRKLNELRRAKINSEYSNEMNVILSDIQKTQSEYKKLYSLRQKLILSVDFNGVLYELSPDLARGVLVKKNEWIADIILPSETKIEAYVTEAELYLIKENSSGYFYSHSISDPRIAAKVVSIDKLNTNQLDCQYSVDLKQNKKQNVVVDTPCYNANELGGDIATYLSDEGAFSPVESIYRVLLKPEKPLKLQNIQRGTVVITAKPQSYAQQFFYQFKKIFIQQSGF